MLYQKPEMAILQIEATDIVRTSALSGGDNNDYYNPDLGDDNSTDAGGDWG